MANVTKVNESIKDDKTRYFVGMEGQEKDAFCWDARAKDLKIGEPLPEGWFVEQGQYGPVLKAPRKPGGGGGMPPAWRNTEAGARFEQEQMNRRTALMQAVSITQHLGREEMATEIADQLFHWLQNVSAPRSGGPGASVLAVAPMGTRTEEGKSGAVSPGVGADTPSPAETGDSPAPKLHSGEGTEAGGEAAIHAVAPPAASTPPAAGDESTLLPFRRNDALTKFKSPQGVVRRYEEVTETELPGDTSVAKFQRMTLDQLATVLEAVK